MAQTSHNEFLSLFISQLSSFTLASVSSLLNTSIDLVMVPYIEQSPEID
jgi:hypothetical protein